MKFLIIGASGFVGNHLFNHLHSIGYSVLGTQSKNKHPNLITFNLLGDRIKNCLDSSFLDSNEPIFGIICASVSQIDYCFQHKEINYQINVKKTIDLIKEMKTLNITPVFVSTSFVFDGHEGNYCEDHSYNPICEYGKHKMEVELFLKENMPETLILRLDKVVGDNTKIKNLFYEWYQKIQKREQIVCIADQIISPTYIGDASRAIVLACQKNLTGIYHISNPKFIPRDELARQFLNFLNQEIPIVCRNQAELNFLDFRPIKTYLNSTKFIKATNFTFTSMSEVFQKFKQNLDK